MAVSPPPAPSSIDLSGLPPRVVEAAARVLALCREELRSEPRPEAPEEVELRVREATNEFARDVMGAVIENRDDGASRIERDGQSWFRVAVTPKTIMTSLGPVTYRRARYRSRADRFARAIAGRRARPRRAWCASFDDVYLPPRPQAGRRASASADDRASSATATGKYGFGGTLEMTPHIGGARVHEVAGFDKAAHGLFAVRSAVWLGMIFVNLSGDAPEFAAFIAPLIGRWAPFTGPDGMAGLVADRAGRRQRPRGPRQLEARGRELLRELSPAQHPSGPERLFQDVRPLQHHGRRLGRRPGLHRLRLRRALGPRLPAVRRLAPDKRSHAEYITLFPNVLLGLHLDHVFAMVLRPLAHDRTVDGAARQLDGDLETHENARATLLAVARDLRRGHRRGRGHATGPRLAGL